MSSASHGQNDGPQTPIPEIDARGLLCPLPVLRLRKRLLALEEDAQICLIATDPAAVIDVPHFCQQGGHRLIRMQPQADGATAYVVARGPLGGEQSPTTDLADNQDS